MKYEHTCFLWVLQSLRESTWKSIILYLNSITSCQFFTHIYFYQLWSTLYHFSAFLKFWEIRVAQRKRGGTIMHREAMWERENIIRDQSSFLWLLFYHVYSWFFYSLSILILFIILHLYWNFEDEIFVRWVECNVPG